MVYWTDWLFNAKLSISDGWECQTVNMTNSESQYLYTDIPIEGIGYLTSVAGGMKFVLGFSKVGRYSS
jgi:hypothetical protein